MKKETEEMGAKGAGASRTGQEVSTEAPVIVMLPLEGMVESAINPRKDYPKERMAELAASVKERGIVQPMMVLKRPDGRYELIFGHRRRRAGLAAGLKEGPCIVRENLAAAEIIEIQGIENLQREDLKAMEEGLWYRRLREESKWTVEQMCERFKKSRSHVFNMLALARLNGSARQALEEGKIQPTMARLVATLPSEKLQRHFIQNVLEDKWNGPMSYREAKDLLEGDYIRNLSGAPWKWDDEEWPKELKCTSCAKCPKRSGNIEEYEGREKSPNVCTDVECYDGKAEAFAERQAKELAANGAKVIRGEQWDDYRVRDRWVKLKDQCYDDRKGRTWKQLMEAADKTGKGEKPVIGYAETTTDGFAEIVEKAALQAYLRETGVLKIAKAKVDPDRKKQLAEVREDALRENAQCAVIVEGCEKAKVSEDLWRLLAVETTESTWFDAMRDVAKRRALYQKGEDPRKKLVEYASQASAGQCFGLIMELMVCRGLRGSWGQEKRAKKLAEMLGVDLSKATKEYLKRQEEEKEAKKVKQRKWIWKIEYQHKGKGYSALEETSQDRSPAEMLVEFDARHKGVKGKKATLVKEDVGATLLQPLPHFAKGAKGAKGAKVRAARAQGKKGKGKK